jgi:hypothetical protein
MQWKGFMDGNQNYLADRLEKIKKIQGPNQFYSFFKDFLLPLFHDGLGAGTKIELPVEIANLVGNIPYVNGGIFSEHELESKNDLSISDEAFEEIQMKLIQMFWVMYLNNLLIIKTKVLITPKKTLLIT